MTQPPTATVEDYIKRIYMLQQQQGGERVAMGTLAEAINVVPGTATAMVKKLADADYVTYEPYSGVTLTDTGRQLALDVLRRHRLIELFLVDVLGLDWSEVHDEAEHLEHAISEKLLSRIDATLNHPTLDPHGDPIPTTAGVVKERRLIPLSECDTGAKMRIARIAEQSGAFLRFAADRGLRPGRTVAVESSDRVGETLRITPEDHEPLTLGRSAARKILVERMSE